MKVIGEVVKRADQQQSGQSENGRRATRQERKRTASERQDLQSIPFISGGKI